MVLPMYPNTSDYASYFNCISPIQSNLTFIQNIHICKTL